MNNLEQLNQRKKRTEKVEHTIRNNISNSLSDFYNSFPVKFDPDVSTILNFQIDMLHLFTNGIQAEMNRLSSYRETPIPDIHESVIMREVKEKILDSIRNTNFNLIDEQVIRNNILKQMEEFLRCYQQNIRLLKEGPMARIRKEEQGDEER